MFKKVTGLLLIISLLAIAGCSSGTSSTATPTQPASVKTIRTAEISSAWTVKQLEVNLDSPLTIWLILANGDKVDGYFYLESGTGVSFNVTANSLIYESKAPAIKNATLTSDRFSFTATSSQGIAYGLSFSADGLAAQAKGTKLFLEIMYPVTGSLNFPLGTK